MNTSLYEGCNRRAATRKLSQPQTLPWSDW